jgi:hypothetical protein
VTERHFQHHPRSERAENRSARIDHRADRCECLFGAALLNKADDRIDDYHRQDHQCVDIGGDEGGTRCRGASPATGETSRRRCNGAMRPPKRAASCFCAMILTLRQAHGIIGLHTTFRPIARCLTKAPAQRARRPSSRPSMIFAATAMEGPVRRAGHGPPPLPLSAAGLDS